MLILLLKYFTSSNIREYKLRYIKIVEKLVFTSKIIAKIFNKL